MTDCFYCLKDARLHDLMEELCQLRVSTVYLFRDQSFHGRCVVAYEEHLTELHQLPPAALHLFMEDVAKVSQAMSLLFSPRKINYAIFGDLVSHLHFHLVPKYADGPLWGEPFAAGKPPVKHLSPEDFSALRELIREALLTPP